MKKPKEYPACNRYDCCNCVSGKCQILIELPKKIDECKFFRTAAQLRQTVRDCTNRLNDIASAGGAKNAD